MAREPQRNTNYELIEEMAQIAREKSTKVTGDLKVGAKVTIEYRMVATDVEVKGGKSK